MYTLRNEMSTKIKTNEFCWNLIFMKIWFRRAAEFCKYIKQVLLSKFIVQLICSPFLRLSDMLQSLCDFPVTWKCKYFLTYIWLSSVIFMSLQNVQVVNIPLLIIRYYFSSIWSFVYVLHKNLGEKNSLDAILNSRRKFLVCRIFKAA